MAFLGNNSAALAAQREAIRPEMAKLMLLSSVFWGKMEALDGVTPVGTRPTRIPTLPQVGANPSVPNFDGGPLGRGQAPQEVPAYASCASFLQSIEWTLLSDWATDSDAKAVQSYTALTNDLAFKSFGSFMDVVAQNDGSNVIDTIVAVGTGSLTVSLANYFQSGQYVDIFTATNGTYVTTLQIATEAMNTNTLAMTTAIPGTVQAGMVIAVHGSTATSNSGMFGIKYFNVGQDTGNYLGIPRASYPSRYIANSVTLNNQSLTPSAIRGMQVAGAYAIGSDYEDSKPVVHCGPDFIAAWESNYLGVMTGTREAAGNRSMDMLPREPPGQIAGRTVLGPNQWGNPRATPGRGDFLDMADWKRLETKSADWLEWGGQTQFPVIASDGGLAAGTLAYIGIVSQIINLNPRRQSFISGYAIPRYVLSH